MNNTLVQWLFARLKEQSTWVGLISLLSAIGVSLSPEQMSAIVTLGVSFASAILILMPDAGSKK